MPPLRRSRRAVPWLLAVASSTLLTLSMPGSGSQAWLAFVALVPLLVALDGVPVRRAAAIGFVAGAAFWTVTVLWPAPWVIHYGGVGWVASMATAAVVIGTLSTFTAVFATAVVALRDRSGITAVLVGASAWVAVELVRAALTGFPWAVLGVTQWRRLALIQIAAITGVYGVSFAVAAVNLAVARLLRGDRRYRDRAAACGAAAMVVVLVALPGWLASPRSERGTTPPIAIVQGNVDQSVRWDRAYVDTALALHERLTRDAARDGAKLVVWPETTVPLDDKTDARWLAVIDLARELDVYLIVGAPHGIGDAPWNSAFLIAPDGTIGRYDKRHLLPFAEYVPWRGALGFLRVVTGDAISRFTPGTDPVVWATPFGRLAAAICYEAILPGESRESFVAGADVLVNLTNDAWFGPTPTPVHHLALATFRAVEHRAWLVRAANSGISAFIAPDGRIVAATRLYQRGVLTGAVAPRAETTFYSRYGDVFAWSALGGTVGMLIPLPIRRRRPVEVELAR